MSYTNQEVEILSYVVSFFDSNNFKLLAPLIRKEFGNVRTASAYVSRMYMLKGIVLSLPLSLDQVEEYNKLTFTFNILKNVLKPEEEEEEKEETTSLVQAEFYHYKITAKRDFLNLKKQLQKEKEKVKELERKLEEHVEKTVSISSSPFPYMPKLERHNAEFINIEDVINLKEEEEEKMEVPVEVPVFSESLIKYFDQLEEDMKPRTIEEWGKYKLQTKPTHHVYVKSEADKDKKYMVRYIGNTNSYHCECLAWKYQKVDPVLRTCKHINAVFPDSKKYKYKSKSKSGKKLII